MSTFTWIKEEGSEDLEHIEKVWLRFAIQSGMVNYEMTFDKVASKDRNIFALLTMYNRRQAFEIFWNVAKSDPRRVNLPTNRDPNVLAHPSVEIRRGGLLGDGNISFSFSVYEDRDNVEGEPFFAVFIACPPQWNLAQAVQAWEDKTDTTEATTEAETIIREEAVQEEAVLNINQILSECGIGIGIGGSGIVETEEGEDEEDEEDEVDAAGKIKPAEEAFNEEEEEEEEEVKVKVKVKVGEDVVVEEVVVSGDAAGEDLLVLHNLVAHGQLLNVEMISPMMAYCLFNRIHERATDEKNFNSVFSRYWKKVVQDVHAKRAIDKDFVKYFHGKKGYN